MAHPVDRENNGLIPIVAESRAHCLDHGDRENFYSCIKNGILPAMPPPEKAEVVATKYA